MRSDKEYKDLSVKEFTKAAGNYGTDKAGVYKMCAEDYDPILNELKKEKFDTLLDAGCGNAPMLSLLVDEFPDVKFTGLDLTPAMIESAKAKNLPNTVFAVGDCENMPFEDNSFDVIINSQSYHHYPNPQSFFNSAYAVLKPGGRLIVRDNTSTNKVFLWIANHIEMPLLNMIGHGDVRVSSLEEVRTYCTNAGFRVEKLEAQKKLRMHLVARKDIG